jgi:uncharacterized membrane protein
MKHLLLTIGAGLIGLIPLAGVADAADIADTVILEIDPATSSVTLGENLDLQVRVFNEGVEPTAPLVIHLDITDPSRTRSVDPEDWTSTLSQPVGVVAPGESRTIDWNMQPISAGSFAVYTVALSPGVDNIASSNVMQVTVIDQRSLNPGGILPVALGVPAVIGALLLLQMRLARRGRSPN